MTKAEKFVREINFAVENSEDTGEIFDVIQHEAVNVEEYEGFDEYEFRDSSILIVPENLEEVDCVM